MSDCEIQFCVGGHGDLQKRAPRFQFFWLEPKVHTAPPIISSVQNIVKELIANNPIPTPARKNNRIENSVRKSIQISEKARTH